MKHTLWLSIVIPALAVPATTHAQVAATPAVAPRDSSRTFGLRELAIGVAGLAVVTAIDPVVARDLQTGTSAGTLQFDRQLDRFGDPTGTIPIIGGIALTGLITRNHALTRAAIRATESVVLADLVTEGGKYLVGRTRPYVDGDLHGYDFHAFGSTSPSFPSGHSANAFALAASLSDAIGKKWATVGLFALATGTGWARMSEQQHWLSDVIAGAVVGVGSAKFVEGKVHIFGLRAPRFILGPQTMGMHLTF